MLVTMTDDLDIRDLGEVLRRGVLPVTRALFAPGELMGIDVYLVGRPDDHEPPYGAEVHVRVTDIERNVWTCKAGVYTPELQSAEDLAYWLSEAIENDISESGYAWGEQRTFNGRVPGPLS
jgi:hypothetical protein